MPSPLLRPAAGVRSLVAFNPLRVVTGRWLVVATSLAVLLLWVLSHALQALAAAGTLPPPYGDGPYQLFNPLRRIAAGQTGGIDFQYFHGLGVPYIHYPIFALGGKDFHASELSRHLVTAIAYLACYLFVFAAATRRFTPTVGLTAACLLLAGLFSLEPLGHPQNAILGVRTACPMLIVGVLLLGLTPRREALIAGGLAGVGFVLGTDHGVAAAAMLAAVWVIRRVVGHPARRLVWLPLAAGTFAVTAGGLLLAIGGPQGAVAALKYGLVEIPSDQFWFFGGQSLDVFLKSPAELLSDYLLMTHLAGAGVLAALAAWWMRHDADGPTRGPVLLAVLVYGVLSTVAYLGGTAPHYFAPLARVELVVGLLLGRRAYLCLAGHPDLGPTVTRFGVVGAAVFFAVGLLVGPVRTPRASLLTVGRDIHELRTRIAAFPQEHPGLAAKTRSHLDLYTAVIDADRAAQGVTRPPVLWSTYAGLLEAHYGVFHPHCDYVIHALGPTRRAGYLDAFRRAEPDYVSTPRRGGFEEWIQQATWPVYEELALNYDPVVKSWAGVLWRRRPGPWRMWGESAGEVSYEPPLPNTFPVKRPAGAGPSDPLVLEVEYETEAPLAAVPVIGKLPRYFLAFTGAVNREMVGLPPSAMYGGRVSVVVQPVAGQEPMCGAMTASLTGGSVRVKHVRVRALSADVVARVKTGVLDE